jgi:hypothetical protein
MKLYEILNKNCNYVVKLSCLDELIKKEFRYMTITCKNGKPMYEELEQCDELSKTLNINKCFDKDFDTNLFKIFR